MTAKERGRAGRGEAGFGSRRFPGALGTETSALQPAWLSHAEGRPLKSQTTNKIAAGTRSLQGSRREILHHGGAEPALTGLECALDSPFLGKSHQGASAPGHPVTQSIKAAARAH